MKKLLLGLLFTLFSCTSPTARPENLIPKEKMAQLVVDFAVYEQSYNVTNTTDLESSTRFILKKHKITSKQFKESYQYYLTNADDLEGIYEEAEKLLMQKDPKLKDYIKKKEKENPSMTEKLRS